MTDQFAVLKADVSDEPYRVEIPTVGKFTIPHINTLDVFELNETIGAATTDLDLIIETMQLVMAPKDFERLRKAKLNRPTLIALYVAWQEHCGLREGESPASSD